MRIYDAARLARALMVEHGLVGWTFRFDKAKRRFGVCRYKVKVIGLSGYLTQMNEEARVRDTILHEIAHALAGPKIGHGPKWRQVCRSIGARPVRCYVSVEVNKPKANYIGTCLVCSATFERLRLSRRVRNESSCPRHGVGGYDERFKLTWKRLR